MRRYSVTELSENANGELVPIPWQSNGDEFNTLDTVISVLKMNDNKWSTLKKITIEVVENDDNLMTRAEYEARNNG